MRTYWSSSVAVLRRLVVVACAVALAGLALSGVAGAASPEIVPPRSFEVQTAIESSNGTVAEAKANLAIQHQASKVNVVGHLEEGLDESYASVWFDNETGEFVVPIATAGEGRAITQASESIVEEEFSSAALGDDFRTEVVNYSTEELEAAQDALAQQLAPYLEGTALRTAIDPEHDAVDVRIPDGLSTESQAEIEAVLQGLKIPTELEKLPAAAFEAEATGCDEARRLCDLPVRGGEAMYGGPAWPGPHGEELEEVCSVGFRANGYDGHKYILTAGHCAKQGANPNAPTNWSWKTTSVAPQDNHYIGSTAQFHYPGKDWAKIDATGTWADTPPWPTQVAYWGSTYEYPVIGEARAYVGETLCHVGMNTGASCGIVAAEGVNAVYSEGTPEEAKMNGLFEVVGKGLALGGGDSGGPVVANDVALGVTSGGISAYNNATLYFSDITEATAELNVDIAGAGITEAITGAPLSIGTNGATVSGQVDPHGMQTEVAVEWGQAGLERLTSYTVVGEGQGFVPVSKEITGLEPATTYRYRITATNGFGEAHGAEGTFTTAPVPPVVTTEAAEAVKKNSATIGGTVNPRGAATTYQVEYGTTASYGSVVPVSPEAVGAGRTPVKVRQALTGLSVGTNYHFRVKATNAGGTSYGPDRSFMTPEKPSIASETARYLNTLEPQVQATINPERAATTYQFEYGTTASYGLKAPVPAGELGTGPVQLRAGEWLSGLARNTTYHYRVVAENEVGVVKGPDQTFTTLPPCKGAEAKCLWSLQEPTNPTAVGSYEMKSTACLSKTECVAVGKNTATGRSFVDRWNGTAWSLLEASVNGEMRHVSCLASGCFAVGVSGGSAAAWWIGEISGVKTWAVYPSALALPTGATETSLSGVSCVASEGVCTAVGSYRGSDGAFHPLVERWNGSAWSLQSAPNPAEGTAQNAMLSVGCSALGCVAVGEAAGKPVAESWFGGTWTLNPPKLPAGAKGGKLSSVACAGASCMAVGNYYEVAGQEKALAESFAGLNWSLTSAPNPAGSQGYVELAGVSCSSSSCTAVGSYASAVSGVPTEYKTLAESWDGTAWTIRTSANVTGKKYSRLADVSCSTATACTAVGQSSAGFGQLPESLAERWNGSAWAIQALVNPEMPVEDELAAVSCISNTLCLAAGKDLAGEQGYVSVWNGTGWTIASTFAGEMKKISCGTESCVGVGVKAGTAEAWSVLKVGSAWTTVTKTPPLPAGTTASALTGVSCSAPTACTAVGSYRESNGTYHPLVERWNGTAWSRQSAPDPLQGSAQNAMLAVSCAESSCMTVGEAAGKPVAELWEGSAWVRVEAPWAPSGATVSTLVGISCPTAESCMAVGSTREGLGTEKPLVERWNGFNWTSYAAPSPAGTKGYVNLTDVSCLSPRACFSAGYYASAMSGSVPLALKSMVQSWSGAAWTVVTSPNLASQTFNSLAGVSCTTSIDCTAVGSAYSNLSKRPPVQLAMRFE